MHVCSIQGILEFQHWDHQCEVNQTKSGRKLVPHDSKSDYLPLVYMIQLKYFNLNFRDTDWSKLKLFREICK